MATAAITAEYQADAAEFASELAENGFLCSFGVHGEGAEAWSPSGEFTEVGKAAVFPSDWKADFSDDVRNDDVMYLVAATLDLDSVTHMVEPSGKERKIVKVEKFTPDGATVIYSEVQLR